MNEFTFLIEPKNSDWLYVFSRSEEALEDFFDFEYYGGDEGTLEDVIAMVSGEFTVGSWDSLTGHNYFAEISRAHATEALTRQIDSPYYDDFVVALKEGTQHE